MTETSFGSSCPHRPVMTCPEGDSTSTRPDRDAIAVDLLREPGETNRLLDGLLEAERAYLQERFHPEENPDAEARVNLELARTYRQVAMAPFAYKIMLHAMQMDEAGIAQDASVYDTAMYGFEQSFRSTLTKSVYEVTDSVESSPYAQLWKRFGESIVRLEDALKMNQAILPFAVVSSTTDPRERLTKVFGDNVDTVRDVLLPRCIALARTATPVMPESLLDTAYAAVPNLVAIASANRKVSIEIQFGKKLAERRKQELRDNGCIVSPEVDWAGAFYAYERTSDPEKFVLPARDYDSVLLDPDAPAYIHRTFKNGVWTPRARGACGGRISTPLNEEERSIADSFFTRHRLEGTPEDGIEPAETLAYLGVQFAEHTLFASKACGKSCYCCT